MRKRPVSQHVENGFETRRRIIASGTLIAAALGASIAGLDRAFAQPAAATPACQDADEPTVRQTAGPYFKPDSPERTDFVEPGMTGQVMELSGSVLTQRCSPVARALIDIWQADAGGAYDLSGFRLRGHLFSGADGSFTLRTIVPGVYPGRTRHIHVRVQAPGSALLTTQLYFPDERGNRRDGLYRRELELRVRPAREHLACQFNFVLDRL